MLGHYHGQVINYAEIGRSFGISDMSIRKYMDILAGTFMVRVLEPWYVNVGKRLIKRPKIYFRDSGIFHSMMFIENLHQLQAHNKLGASWEGFALESVCRKMERYNNPVYFWSTHRGAEVDLFWQCAGKNWACEFKYMDAPRLTRSMQFALNDLELENLWVIYPGKDQYVLSGKISVIPLAEVTEQTFNFS